MNNPYKCSSKKHSEKQANFYCDECRIYMCNQCESFHSDIFQNKNFYKKIKILLLFNYI